MADKSIVVKQELEEDQDDCLSFIVWMPGLDPEHKLSDEDLFSFKEIVKSKLRVALKKLEADLTKDYKEQLMLQEKSDES